jgi:hypothetical protein
MWFRSEQHLEMAKRLYDRAQAELDPKKAARQEAMAQPFRKLGEKAAAREERMKQLAQSIERSATENERLIVALIDPPTPL